MRVFHCTHCGHLIFFENTECVHCHHKLAYLPDLQVVGSLEPMEGNLWRSPLLYQNRVYRLCDNYTGYDICNWALPVDSPHTYCESCRFTQIVPDLTHPDNRKAWYKLEVAKRRLLYTLRKLGCPMINKVDDPKRGLSFHFLKDNEGNDEPPVVTGHADGIITINIAEADDAERERRREQLHEPYRTLLGHFRHEVGHYYWAQLIQQDDAIECFRKCFGDEREDYALALQRHYEQGPPQDWPQDYVSAYASAHPWEDWAETWAHYLHMTDTLETAAACGLSLRPARPDEPQLENIPAAVASQPQSFEQFLDSWFPVTYVLNNLNRGLGLSDGYPFVLSRRAIDKLRFVHGVIQAASRSGSYAGSFL